MISGIDTTFLVELEIEEAEHHAAARKFLEERIVTGREELAMAPQVLAEFVHVVTDPRRFSRPLDVAAAVARAGFWWHAREVRRVVPTAETTDLFLAWMTGLGLGRKRILDTLLAATYSSAGIDRILTTNARDFAVFEGITAVMPGEARGASRGR